ncbi:TIGR03915 family putative DNA repair protein, partial [Bacteroidales bacterium OttesenSCG-928-A17]|nr:TIGR03915 family putative DNA repair protein [Bacteroidales bacterium OttesenSCG-928-A17]
MLYYLFDNTFEGLLTAVFDAFSRKENPDKIAGHDTSIPLFTDTYTVTTDGERSQRVLSALKKKISKSALQMLFVSFLAESEQTYKHLFNYIAKAVTSKQSIELNFGDEDVMELSKTFKKIQNEYTRMKQFVRFQKAADGIFFAAIEPLYDVIPLCTDFFRDRYADQQWILYDTKRNYGIFYDLDQTQIVKFDQLPISLQTGQLQEDKLDESEIAFRNLWKDYLKAVTIQERKNLKLQKQHMP